MPVLGLVTLGSLIGLGGGVLLLSKRGWAKTLSIHAVPFAAGVMLSVSFLDILPEAIENSSARPVFTAALIAMITAFFFEQFFLHIHHHTEKVRTTIKTALPMAVFGDTIHNFIDGLSIAASFIVDPSLGILVAVATFLHEIPQEMGDFGLMLAGGWSRKRAIVVNLFSALAAYLGALVVLLLPFDFQGNLGIILGATAGIFIYISASDLLPEVQEEHKDNLWHKSVLFLGGAFLVWLLIKILPL